MTNITINGKVVTVLEKNYEDKTTVYLQFLMESEAKGMEILKVKLSKAMDIEKVAKEMVVSVPVSISSVNGNMYYSQTDSIKYLKDVK